MINIKLLQKEYYFCHPMNSITKNITIKLLSYLVIGMISILIVNKSIYLHTHKLADGSVISHAHPYNKSDDDKPFKSHHHADTQLLFFQSIKILFFTSFIAFFFFKSIKKAVYAFFTTPSYTLAFYNSNKGRAPPIS